MQEKSDVQLLRDYAGGDEGAFRVLVTRHTDFVFSAALRQVNSPDLAGDVAQGVFTDLACKAQRLAAKMPADGSLAGWLHRATRYAALSHLRDARRRLTNERQAMELLLANSESAPDWERIRPVLDEALDNLGDEDREALLLRYFKNRDFRAVGLALGVSDDTAQKRVSRAVERLREFLAKRGVVAGASGLALVVAANSVQAAPVGLAVSLATAAVKGSATATANLTAIKSAVKLVVWTKGKTAIAVGVGILLTVGTTALVTMLATNVFQPLAQIIPRTRLRLPVGTGTPAIGIGARHGVILASDGSLWSWGENNNGWPVLGLGNIQTQLCLRRIGNESNWSCIAVGWDHNMAIKSDGTLWGWGQNIYGQLGDGSGARWYRRPAPSVPGNSWRQVAVGGSHSIALKRDGTLWAWGNNWAGQLGIGSTNRIVRDATQIGSATNWIKVWAGLLETVAMKSDGSLWYWGENPNPSLPQSGAGASNIFAPTLVSPDTNWVDVGFGPYTVLAVKSDGTLWTWGRQAHEFSGAGDRSLNASPSRVGIESDWRTITPCGWHYQILSKNDGSLWGMHLITGERGSAKLEAKRIELNKSVEAFAGSGRREIGVVLTRDGEVWTWGRVLGQYTAANTNLQSLAKLARKAHLRADWGESEPVMSGYPWQLPNLE